MSIQSVGNNRSLWQTMRKDLKTSSQDISAFQTTQKWGNGDQIQTSQNVPQQAMTSLPSAITNVRSVKSGTPAGARSGIPAGAAQQKYTAQQSRRFEQSSCDC